MTINASSGWSSGLYHVVTISLRNMAFSRTTQSISRLTAEAKLGQGDKLGPGTKGPEQPRVSTVEMVTFSGLPKNKVHLGLWETIKITSALALSLFCLSGESVEMHTGDPHATGELRQLCPLPWNGEILVKT